MYLYTLVRNILGRSESPCRFLPQREERSKYICNFYWMYISCSIINNWADQGSPFSRTSFFPQKTAQDEFWWHPKKIFFIKRILKRAEKMIIRWSKVRTYRRCKISQEKSSSFSWMRKDVCGRCRDGRSRPSCWPILDTSAEWSQTIELLIIFGGRWFDFLGAAHNKSLDIPLDAQHHLFWVVRL